MCLGSCVRTQGHADDSCDFHPGFQQVAIFDNRMGEMQEKRLQQREEAEQFYRGVAGQEVRVGMEACGHYPWFERLLAELGIELWFGDAARVRAAVVRKQKTERAVRKNRSLAKVAVARKLATRLYLMLREDWTTRSYVRPSCR
jgi:transposase